MRLTERVYMAGSGSIGISHVTDCNIYLIDGGGSLALIDAGAGISPHLLLNSIHKDGFDHTKIDYIVNTHSHWDHARGDAYLKEVTGAKLVIHEAGVDAVERVLWSDGFLAKEGIGSRPAKVDVVVGEISKLQVGDVELTLYHTPGHSPEDICITMEDEGNKVLFSGDTVLANGIPGVMSAVRTDFARYGDSVARMAKLNCEVLLPGHNLFTLANGSTHVQMLADKMNGRWQDVVFGFTLFPTWWLGQNPALYDEARRSPGA